MNEGGPETNKLGNDRMQVETGSVSRRENVDKTFKTKGKDRKSKVENECTRVEDGTNVRTNVSGRKTNNLRRGYRGRASRKNKVS